MSCQLASLRKGQGIEGLHKEEDPALLNNIYEPDNSPKNEKSNKQRQKKQQAGWQRLCMCVCVCVHACLLACIHVCVYAIFVVCVCNRGVGVHMHALCMCVFCTWFYSELFLKALAFSTHLYSKKASLPPKNETAQNKWTHSKMLWILFHQWWLAGPDCRKHCQVSQLA